MEVNSYFSTVRYIDDPKEYNRQWYIKNREKRINDVIEYKNKNRDKVLEIKRKDSRRYMLEKRYGITVDRFDEMLKEQNSVCAICSKEFKTNKDKCVDYCHHTGKIRKILCFNCNIGIGKFKDSIELLQKALKYLKKYE